MGRKKLEGKKPDIDGAVAYMISKFKIATLKDVEDLMVRMDRLEANIKRMFTEYDKSQRSQANGNPVKNAGPKPAVPIYETVLDLIKKAEGGIDFKTLYRMTGLGEKTLRNTLYRLKTTGKIITARRGVYVVASNEPEIGKVLADETETELIETEEGVAV